MFFRSNRPQVPASGGCRELVGSSIRMRVVAACGLGMFQLFSTRRMTQGWTTSSVLLSIMLAACRGSAEEENNASVCFGTIQFAPMYLAFGGSHSYSVTPNIPAADPASGAADPILASKTRWALDDRILEQEAFLEIPGAIKLTTRASGKTSVTAFMTSLHGHPCRWESLLSIGRASDEQWGKGDARYNRGTPGDNASLLKSLALQPTDAGETWCELPSEARSGLSKDAPCEACHEAAAARVSPTQTAGYSDEQLRAVITEGQRPPGYAFNSAALRMHPRPDCVFAMFHKFAVDEETVEGLVLKLRSLPPGR